MKQVFRADPNYLEIELEINTLTLQISQLFHLVLLNYRKHCFHERVSFLALMALYYERNLSAFLVIKDVNKVEIEICRHKKLLKKLKKLMEKFYQSTVSFLQSNFPLLQWTDKFVPRLEILNLGRHLQSKLETYAVIQLGKNGIPYT